MKKSIAKANIVIVCMFILLLSVAFGGAKTTSVQADGRVIYSGNTQDNKVCFMINVYQGEEYVLDMLDILNAYKVKTTFFVGGSWAVKNVETLKSIYANGHEIGNHGFYHKDQDKLDYESNIKEISMCHKVIQQNLGYTMTLFAPPSGAYSSTTVDASVNSNYKVIMWTHDTIDWRDQDAELIFKRATKNLSNGDLILMHPTKASVQALKDILAYAINSGFTPTTVSQCL